MANWSNPTLTSLYTDFLSQLKDRDVDIAVQFEGTVASNIPSNAIRWNSTANRWNKWNGSSWAELTSTYALTGLSTTGNASIGGALSVTGATTLGAATGVTPATGDTSVNLATTAWVRNQSYATLASPALTGAPTAPTAALSTNNTQLATTAFTLAQIANDAPTKSGTGATGTWNINVLGSAPFATTATTAANVQGTADGSVQINESGSSNAWYGRILSRNSGSNRSVFLGTYSSVAGVFAHNNALNAWEDLYVNTSDGTSAYGGKVRLPGTTFIQNSQALHAGNFNSYAPTLTGTGASGTWGINISGNAATSSAATYSTTAATTNDNSTASAVYPVFVGSTSGNQAIKLSSAGLSYVPSTGTLNATAYTGNGTALSNLSTFSQTAGTGGDLPVGSFGTYVYIDVVATGTKTVAWFSCTINHQNTNSNDFIMSCRIYDLTGGATQVGAFDTGHSTGPFALSFNSVLHASVNATTIVGRTYRYQLLLYKTQPNGPTFPNNGRIGGIFL